MKITSYLNLDNEHLLTPVQVASGATITPISIPITVDIMKDLPDGKVVKFGMDVDFYWIGKYNDEHIEYLSKDQKYFLMDNADISSTPKYDVPPEKDTVDFDTDYYDKDE